MISSRYLYFYASVVLLITYVCGVHGVGTTTDGNNAANAEWGASTACSYDFIISGAGDAGSVVAARLAAVGNWTVLLIEAGGTSSRDLGGTDYVASSYTKNPNTGAVVRGVPWTRIDVPIYGQSITEQPAYDEYNWEITNSACGKTLGGSMAHNGMIWGHPTQYNLNVQWNVTGWSYNQFIPYQKKVENYTNSGFSTDTANLGYSGPVQVRTAAVISPFEQAFYNACIAAGIPYQPDFQNGVNVAGVGYSAFNIGNNGTSIRQTTALTYLRPLLGSPQLTISLHSQVARVIYAPAGYSPTALPTANGVQFIVTSPNGVQTKQTAYARKEVILAGGAILTAQTLMLSGIGPRSQLTQFGITPVVYNENVGRNMRNHLAAGVAYSGQNVNKANVYSLSEAELAYGQNGTGVLATYGLGGTVAQIRTRNNIVDPDMILLPNAQNPDPFNQVVSLVLEHPNPEYAYGVVTLNSSNPQVPPVFTPNINLSNNDVNTFVRGIQIVRGIMGAPAAAAYFGTEVSPGPSYNTTAALQAWVRLNTGIVYHYYGSAKMGNAGDPLRVVDPNLRVVGVNNLRVVDSSIIPNVTHYLLQAVVAGIAEKGAASIINAWS